MAIFRGIGGAGSGDNDATVTAVTTKATEAAASATAASSSASSAATSATASANSATTSSTKASEASASNDTATTKAGEASTSATAAANSATASANSATAAASSATDAANAVPQPELAATGSPTFAAITINGNIIATGTVDGRDLQTDGTKLDAIEAGATADQTNDEIKAAVEAATDSNTFTDADHTKLDAIEAGADVTDATNVAAAGALMESELAGIAAVKATTGTFLVADQTKLDGIEAGATADQTNDEIRAAVEAATDSNIFTDADHDKLNGIEAGATADQTAAEVVNTPAGSIVATDVQAAINELDGGDAGTATNLAGGLGGSVPYQTGAGATSMLANGTAGQVFQSNGTTAAPSWIDNAYDISFGIAGAPPASQVYQITMVRAVDLAAEFAGSDGDVITVPSTGAIEIDVHKNGTTIGDIQISTGGALTFNSDEPSVTSFAAGDRLGLVMPADLDNCEDLNIVFKGVLV